RPERVPDDCLSRVAARPSYFRTSLKNRAAPLFRSQKLGHTSPRNGGLDGRAERQTDRVPDPGHGTDRASRQRAARSPAVPYGLSRRDQGCREGHQYRGPGELRSRALYRATDRRRVVLADEAAKRGVRKRGDCRVPKSPVPRWSFRFADFRTITVLN